MLAAPGSRRRLSAIATLGLVLQLHASCAASPEARLAEARDRAIAWFASDVDEVEAGWSAIFAYLHRRFGVIVTTAEGRTLHDATEGVEPAAMFEVFRRLVDPGATVDVARIAALESPIDRISASAIHCDHIPLPGDWIDILRRASRMGAYALTHAVTAATWSLENGCVSPLQLAALRAEQIHLLQQLIEGREELEKRHAAASDIWIEAVAMLFYADAGHRVRPEWIEAVLALQRPDGGWPLHPRASESDPHTTALALWVVLEVLEPHAPRVPWLR